MGTAMGHHPAQFLPGIIAVDKVHAMVVVKLDTVAVQFLRHGGKVVVEQGQVWDIVPTEMGAEDHCRRYICFGKALCPALDSVHIVRVGPVKIRHFDPPGSDALTIHKTPPLLALSYLQRGCLSNNAQLKTRNGQAVPVIVISNWNLRCLRWCGQEHFLHR